MLPTPQRRKPKQGEFLRAAHSWGSLGSTFKTSGESSASNPKEDSGSTASSMGEKKGAAVGDMRLGGVKFELSFCSSNSATPFLEVQSRQSSPVHVQFCWWACPVNSAINTVMSSLLISVDSRFTGQEAACLGSPLG